MKKTCSYSIYIASILLSTGVFANSSLEWNGHWKTTVPHHASVCGTTQGYDVPAGPIWNNHDAKIKCPIAISKSRQNRKIAKIVAFGDSLSDGGTYQGLALSKAGTLNNVTYSPAGRFTTNPGKVWVEYLAEHYKVNLTPNRFTGPGVGPNGSFGIVLQGGSNYAEGGAQISESPAFASFQTNINGQLIDATGQALTEYSIQGKQCLPTGNPVPNGLTAASLKDQIDRFLSDDPSIANTTLIAVQGGSNDVLKQLHGINNCGPAYIKIAHDNILVSSIQFIKQINRLTRAGAQKIIVVTTPDLSQTPFGLQGGSQAQVLLKSLSHVFNTTTKYGLRNQKKVHLSDFNRFFSDVLASPSAYGIAVTNNGVACNINNMYINLAAYANPHPALRTTSSVFCNEIDYVNAAAPQTFMFADSIHPTTGIHQHLAKAIYADLKNKKWK